MKPVKSRAMVPVKERMKTCLFRRRSASASVAADMIVNGFDDNTSALWSVIISEVVGGSRDVRNDPIDAMTVSDYVTVRAIKLKYYARRTDRSDAQCQEEAKDPEALPVLEQFPSCPPVLLAHQLFLCVLTSCLGTTNQKRCMLVQVQQLADRAVWDLEILFVERQWIDDLHEHRTKQIDSGADDPQEYDEFARIKLVRDRVEGRKI